MATQVPKAPQASSPAARRTMQGNRGRDTRPEMRLRRMLHASGWRYRVDKAPLPGWQRRADIVFSKQRVAVFVDGCFWHGCPQHGTSPKRNSGYWRAKIARNVERDRETDALLEEAGWTVVRVWEHEPAADAKGRIVAALRASPG